jgi:hypothetical protein
MKARTQGGNSQDTSVITELRGQRLPHGANAAVIPARPHLTEAPLAAPEVHWSLGGDYVRVGIELKRHC